jgi:hypothetical protein
VNPVRILFWMALATPLLAFWPSQDEAASDWRKEVERACTSKRYGLRLAAARKVAEAGAAAVPAIREWADEHGRNELPAALVDAVAGQTHVEAEVVQLLTEWANDRDFYWRAQAMRGLALRAPRLRDAATDLRGQFERFRGDPAWLMRTHARFGLALLGGTAVWADAENDPRARVRLCALLLETPPAGGTVPPLQPLFDALADERTFLGDPWGRRMANEAHKALKAWLGDTHPLAEGGSFDDEQSAIELLLKITRDQSGQDLATPAPRRDPETPFAGGIEILSCKNGDVFAQWTADGEVAAGLDANVRIRLPAEVAKALAEERADSSPAGDLGVVICDSMRLLWNEPEVHVRTAPDHLPPATAAWLADFAKAVEDAGNADLARQLRGALGQFAAR